MAARKRGHFFASAERILTAELVQRHGERSEAIQGAGLKI